MKSTTAIAICHIMLSIAVIITTISAAFLAYHNKNGWGWFVFLTFLGLLSLCSVKVEFKGDNAKKKES